MAKWEHFEGIYYHPSSKLVKEYGEYTGVSIEKYMVEYDGAIFLHESEDISDELEDYAISLVEYLDFFSAEGWEVLKMWHIKEDKCERIIFRRELN